MTEINPLVVDLSHHNTITSFEEAYKWGIRGCIYKATEGETNVDPTYAGMRAKALRAGIFWGAYHFFRPGNVLVQVEHFLATASPKPGTLLALDHEDERCSLEMAIEFLKELERRTGQVPVLYSGHVLKQQLDGVEPPPYLATCRLWLAEYGTKAILPPGFEEFWLWQFTGDGQGPGPHDIPGLGMHVDVDSFSGDAEELIATWALPREAGPIPNGGPTKADLDAWGQASLNLLGTKPKLAIDGINGPKTTAALKQLQSQSGLTETGLMNKATVAEMCGAIADWNDERK